MHHLAQQHTGIDPPPLAQRIQMRSGESSILHLVCPPPPPLQSTPALFSVSDTVCVLRVNSTENADARGPYCGVHCLGFALVCFVIRSPPLPPPAPSLGVTNYSRLSAQAASPAHTARTSSSDCTNDCTQEHPSQEGDTCICVGSLWTNASKCRWRGHSVDRYRPLTPPPPPAPEGPP